MKTKVKTVYYCEYCKKHSLMPLLHHEKHCTANPNRRCGMCDNAYGNIPELIVKYKKQIATETKDHGEYTSTIVKSQPKLTDIMGELEGCPACTLAVLRGCGLCGGPFYMEFDYKKERDSWFLANREDIYEG
jgi:hypothetical protein